MNSAFVAQGFCPLARRERRAYPASGSVRSEQRSQRAKDQARRAEVIFAWSLEPEESWHERKHEDWDYWNRQHWISSDPALHAVGSRCSRRQLAQPGITRWSGQGDRRPA